MSEQNKTLARRWFEDLFNRGDLDAAQEILSAEFVDHLPREEERGLEELKQYIMKYRAAFPDIRDTIDKLVAEGEKMVVRWTSRGSHQGEFMGVAPTGRHLQRDAPVPHCRKQDSRKLGEHRPARPAGAVRHCHPWTGAVQRDLDVRPLALSGALVVIAGPCPPSSCPYAPECLENLFDRSLNRFQLWGCPSR
jgi:predicted ester cyclase